MPYIPLEIRRELHTRSPKTPGELNYEITNLLNEYLLVNGVGYTRFNDIIGALEAAKLEIYRRLISPYEENKKKVNGEVYHVGLPE